VAEGLNDTDRDGVSLVRKLEATDGVQVPERVRDGVWLPVCVRVKVDVGVCDGVKEYARASASAFPIAKASAKETQSQRLAQLSVFGHCFGRPI